MANPFANLTPRLALVLSVLLTLFFPVRLAASTCSAASGASLVPLVELFTSEGCDSCPPADRWLASHFPPGEAGRAASVLAFHVDYWDRLGWKDRFASARYTERQQAISRANGGNFVYTPQVVAQGRDAPGWSRRGIDAELAAARARPARADIALDASSGTGGVDVRVRAKVSDAGQIRNAALWLAYTDSGLVSQVTAGENRGERLTHDHVVRRLEGPYAVDDDGVVVAKISLPLPAERGIRPALVAFVQNSRDAQVLQTLTLANCPAL